MNWTKLVDRCTLMVDANKNLILNLLYEAEEELTRVCNVYEDEFIKTITVESDVLDLPEETDGTNSFYKKALVVLHNGVKLKAMHEYDFYYQTDNTKHAGTPIGYAIFNNKINFSHKLRVNDKVKVIYYGIVYDHTDYEPKIPSLYHKDLCHYACFMATIKDNPAVASSFMQLWNTSVSNITLDEADRELIYTIREEV